MLTALGVIACLAYCAITGWRCAEIDERDTRELTAGWFWYVLIRGMLWPVDAALWLAERPVQLLLPPPGEDTP
jgi:hypothetical protein